MKSHASDTYDKRREQNHNKKAYELSLALASERKAPLQQQIKDELFSISSTGTGSISSLTFLESDIQVHLEESKKLKEELADKAKEVKNQAKK